MMDCQKIGNGLQVTGIGESALHMVGYLGKDRSSEVNQEKCPSCKQKGLVQALRKYRISFEESILLCENPQCIYPLGSQPLDNLLIPTDKKSCLFQDTRRKRKHSSTGLATCPSEQHLKLSRTDDNVVNTEKTLRDNLIPTHNRSHLLGVNSGQPVPDVQLPKYNNAVEPMGQKIGMEMAAQESSLEIFSDPTGIFSGSETGLSESHFFHEGQQMVQEPLWLQWRNKHALCWLDCILSTMVHLKTLKMTCTESLPESISVIQTLFAKYNKAIALVNTYKKGGGVLEVPLDVMSTAESLLNEIRNTIANLLIPLLKCKLGDEESPVFAFPLLLQKDPPIEKLFFHSYLWKFECSQCGHQVRDRYQKTLTTFTKIIPEWHPLNAATVAPCNNCNHTAQRREMVLEDISPILMMHFVEGLPHSDLKTYCFQFQEDFYQVTAVIQYQKANHFITWILLSDGTWLECDDLKGSYSTPRKNFGVPPSEIHIVIWERRPPQATNYLDLQQQTEEAKNVSVLKGPLDSPAVCVDDDTALRNTPLIFQSSDGLNSQTNEAEKTVSRKESNLLCGFKGVVDRSASALLGRTGDSMKSNPALKDKMVGETRELQDPQEVSMHLMTSEGENGRNEHTQGETNSTCDIQTAPTVTPGVPSSSNYIPVALSVQSRSYDTSTPENKSHQTILENSTQKIPNTVKQAREKGISQVNAPVPTKDPPQSLFKKDTKPFVGSWVKGLLGKRPSFMPKSALTCNAAKITGKPLPKETNLLGRRASQFCGFQPKHQKNQTRKERNKAVGSPQKPLSPSASNASSFFRIFGGTEIALIKSGDSSVLVSKPAHGQQESFPLVENASSSVNKAHQLRLTLLQQLQAKKERLALLDKLTKPRVRNRQSPKEAMNKQLKLGSKEEESCPQNLFNSQHQQIDAVSSESVNSPSTDMSYCSTSSYDDILSELLSPATTVASLDLPQEEECRYLEIGGSYPESPEQNAVPVVGQDTSNSHIICTSLKESGCESHMDLSVLKSSPNLNFESPLKQDTWEDLLTSSVFNSVMDDAEVLHHFDESLLTW